MPTVMRLIVSAVIVLMYSACASTGTPAFRLPPGSKIRVNQELTFASGSRLPIQHGRIMTRRQITAVEPSCQFFLNRSREEMRDPIVIQPGTFTVKRTVQRLDYTWAEDLQFAQSGDETRNLTTVIELSSEQQPEVVDLRCTVWAILRLDGYLTIQQMQATLGDLVTLLPEAE